MYRILLVDDESQIRIGLKKKISWEDAGFTLCGEAANGKEALQAIEELQPDLVITDIRMPVMNGIDLLNACKEKHKNIKLIVISGYDEFEYVKEAMKCGAQDYLLKPVIRKEMQELLQSIYSELEQRKEDKERERQLRNDLDDSLQQLREHFWLRLVRSDNDESRPQIYQEASRLGLEGLINGQARLLFATVKIRDTRHSEELKSPDALLLLAFFLLSRELIEMRGTEGQGHVFRNPANNSLLHLVLHIDDFGLEEAERWLKTDYQNQINSLLKIRSVIGIGEPVKGVGELRKGFLSSQLKWLQSMPAHNHKNLDSHDDRNEETFEFSNQMERQLASSLEEGNTEAFNKHLISIFHGETPMNLQQLSMLCLRMLLFMEQFSQRRGIRLEKVQHMLWGLPESIWRLDKPEHAMNYIILLGQEIMDKLQKAAPSSGNEIIEEIQLYLHDHYASEDVSLSKLANRFHLHYTYLSELFKKQTGQNYSDFLKNLRIEKAKELLGDPLLQVSDITELVGFVNPNYFSQVFKKTVGVSPNEYRQRMTEVNMAHNEDNP